MVSSEEAIDMGEAWERFIADDGERFFDSVTEDMDGAAFGELVVATAGTKALTEELLEFLTETPVDKFTSEDWAVYMGLLRLIRQTADDGIAASRRLVVSIAGEERAAEIFALTDKAWAGGLAEIIALDKESRGLTVSLEEDECMIWDSPGIEYWTRAIEELGYDEERVEEALASAESTYNGNIFAGQSEIVDEIMSKAHAIAAQELGE